MKKRGFFKTIFWFLTGISAGIFFAPKPGKKLRDEISKSKQKLSKLGEIFMEAAKDANSEIKELLNSKEVQKIFENGKKSMEDFLKISEKKIKKFSKEAEKEFKNIVKKVSEKVKRK